MTKQEIREGIAQQAYHWFLDSDKDWESRWAGASEIRRDRCFAYADQILIRLHSQGVRIASQPQGDLTGCVIVKVEPLIAEGE